MSMNKRGRKFRMGYKRNKCNKFLNKNHKTQNKTCDEHFGLEHGKLLGRESRTKSLTSPQRKSV